MHSNDVWEEGWVPAPVFTGAGFRREDNGWVRTPAATAGEDGRDEGLGNGRFASRPYEGGKRDGEGVIATRFLDSAALRSG